MDSIFLKNTKFIKASVIAKELGYTSDYIGQLCRGGKVEAALVGRTWYVADEAIREHKKNRYRSTAKTTKRSLEKMVLAEPVKEDRTIGYKVRVNYETDQAALMPQPKKKAEKDFTAEHDQLQVVSDDKVHEVRLKNLTREPKTGSLQINLATEEPLVAPELVQIVSAQTAPAIVELSHAPVLNKVTVPTKPAKVKQFSPASVVAVKPHSQRSQKSSLVCISVSVSLALVIAVGINLVSSKTTSGVEEQDVVGYIFDTNNVNVIIYTLKNNVFSF